MIVSVLIKLDEVDVVCKDGLIADIGQALDRSQQYKSQQ